MKTETAVAIDAKKVPLITFTMNHDGAPVPRISLWSNPGFNRETRRIQRWSRRSFAHNNRIELERTEAVPCNPREPLKLAADAIGDLCGAIEGYWSAGFIEGPVCGEQWR